MTMSGRAVDDHTAVHQVQGSKQSGRAVAFVNMSHPVRHPLRKGSMGCGRSSTCIWVFSSTTTPAPFRGIYVQSDNVTNLVGELRMAANLELFDSVRLKAVCLPDAVHGRVSDACASAIERVLQCVACAGLDSNVALTIAASLSALMVFLRPLRGASSAMPHAQFPVSRASLQNRAFRGCKASRKLRVRHTGGGPEDNPGSKDHLVWCVTAAKEVLHQFLATLVNIERISCFSHTQTQDMSSHPKNAMNSEAGR